MEVLFCTYLGILCVLAVVNLSCIGTQYATSVGANVTRHADVEEEEVTSTTKDWRWKLIPSDQRVLTQESLDYEVQWILMHIRVNTELKMSQGQPSPAEPAKAKARKKVVRAIAHSLPTTVGMGYGPELSKKLGSKSLRSWKANRVTQYRA